MLFSPLSPQADTMAYLKIGTVEHDYPVVSNPCVANSLNALSLFDLSGMTALITGGNGGIGGGMARGLAEAGAKIIILQIPGEQLPFPQQLAKDTGTEVHVYDCNLADNSDIRKMIPKILTDGHVIDILCNVAGISGGFVPILDENDSHREMVFFSISLPKEGTDSARSSPARWTGGATALSRSVCSVSASRPPYGRER